MKKNTTLWRTKNALAEKENYLLKMCFSGKKRLDFGLFSAMVEIPGVALLESGARNGFFRKEKSKETHQLQLFMERDDSSNKRTILFFHPRKWMWVFFSFGKRHANNHHKHIPKSKIKDSPLHFLLHHLDIYPLHFGKL